MDIEIVVKMIKAGHPRKLICEIEDTVDDKNYKEILSRFDGAKGIKCRLVFDAERAIN